MSPWPVVPLGEVAETALGKMLDRGKARGYPSVPYLRNVNVRWGQIDTSDLLTMELADADLERFAVKAGDLLVCEGGEPGRCAIWPGRSEYIAYQKALHRVRTSDRLDPKFLRYLLEYLAGNGRLNRLSTGSTIAHLPQEQLRRVPVPLAPIDEQRRIVEILEGHLSHLDAAHMELGTAKRRLGAWTTSCVDETLWTTDWPTARLTDLLREPMRNGRSDRAAKGTERGTRTLTLTAVTANRFIEDNTKITVTSAEQARGLWLEGGDIFVQRANTPELVGTTARYEGPSNWAIFPDLLIRVRVDESQVLSAFAAAVLQSTRAHRGLRAKAKGLAGSMPKIDQAAVGSAVIPVPPMAVQRLAVDRLAEVHTAAANLSDAIDAQERRGAHLRRALLAAAFSGRLTGKPSDLEMAEESAAS